MMAQLSRVLTLILSAACWFYGQQAPPESSPSFRSETVLSAQTAGSVGNQAAGPVIHVDVNLRQVDVVVNDPKGRIATDLGPDDFQILENGKPQKIATFSFIEVTPPPTGTALQGLQEKQSVLEWFTGVPKKLKTPGNDILAAPVANPHKEDIRRTIAFVFQYTPLTLGPVVARVRKFIDEQVGPGDMVSIRSTARSEIPAPHGKVMIRDSMGIFQQFTNDKRQLDAAMERIQRTCDFLHSCVMDAPGALAAAIQSLSQVPGRKAVVYVGFYFGPVAPMVTLANRAGVAIYVLNMGSGDGHMADASRSKDDDSLKGPGFFLARNVIELARQTGGRRVLTDPGFDLTSDLNEVMEDLRGYYMLGYYTAATDADFFRADPDRRKAAHGIQVKVLRTGYSVQYRNGFMGAPDAAAPKLAPPPPGREDALTDAMFSIFTADGVRVHLDPIFFASPPDPKTGKRRPVVRAVLEIDGRDVTYTELDDGARKAVLDVAMAVFNADGTQAGANNQTFTISVPRANVAKYPKMSLQHAVETPVSTPGSYQVRAAVRDATSRKVGSSYAYLDIPDFNRRRISLSSLTLSLPAGAAVVPGVRPEWNEFAPGTQVQFGCEVFGLKTPGKPPAPPRVDVGVRLYRGGAPVVDIPPSAATIENKGSLSFLAGLAQIPNDLPAGNYEMEVTAYDRLEPPKKQAAMQWTDLAIVRPEAPE